MFQLTRSRLFKRLIPGLFGFLFVLIASACNSGNLSNDETLTASSSGSTSSASVLTVATSPSFPPFTYTTEDGTLTGFDVDLMRAVGEAAGFEVNFQVFPLIDDVIRSLYGHEVDAAIYAVSITPDRANVVAFSRPYFQSGLAIATQTSNPAITSADALSGKQIGVESGSTGEMKAEAVPGAKVVTFDTAVAALQSLAQGNVDAVINDAPVTEYMISTNQVEGLKIVGEPLTEEFYGIATPKDSPHLEQINLGLTAILENGVYDTIYQQWFNDEPPALPETVPTQSATRLN
ncbi:MAG: basic amino acid ABC transporter substrate-binding protein [Elainellaceae cyanobacterium]